MKTKGLFWGLFFITAGLLFLARNMNWLWLDWDFLRGFWPILLILAGANLILERRNSSAAIVTTVLLALAAPVALFSFLHRDRDFGRYNYHWNDNDDDDDDDWDRKNDRHDDQADSNDNDDDDDQDRDDKVQLNTFTEAMTPDTREAVLKLEGGAGRFIIGETTADLIHADTKQTFGSYKMEVERDPTTRTPTIELKPSEGNVEIKDGNFKNRVDVKLNVSPVWTVKIGMGAGDGDFDLSAFATKEVEIEAGAAHVELKLGDKAAQANVKVSSGVASIDIRVPQSVGCRIEKDGALNINDLDDFENVGGGVYLSPGYDKSTKKISIKFDGGISRFKVKRY